MPVYTYVNENANKHSDEAVALVEAAIQSVLKESLAEKLGKIGAGIDNAGAKVKQFGQDASDIFAGAKIMAKQQAEANKAKAAQQKENAKSGARFQKAAAQEKKAQAKVKVDENKLNKDIAAMEAKKRKQNGELLPSEQQKLDALYDQLFALEN